MSVGSIILIVAGSLLGAAAFTVFMLWLTMTIIKRSDVYRGAVDRYLEHPDITHQIGSPVRAGMFVNGRIKRTGQGGYARLTIPVTGSMGSGIMGVVARREDGVWHYQQVIFQPAEGEEFDLTLDS